MDSRAFLSLILIFLLLPANPCFGQSALNIEVIEGEGAINNVRLRTAREAIVEVQDENHKPVSGALVVFSVKGGNPFSKQVLRATTDFTGRVHANPLQLNSSAGKLDIQVKASYQGRTANKTIHQTNAVEGGAAAGAATAAGVGATASGAGMTALGIAIIAGAAAGGVVGGLAGTGVIGGGGGGKTAQISIGTPSIH